MSYGLAVKFSLSPRERGRPLESSLSCIAPTELDSKLGGGKGRFKSICQLDIFVLES